LSQVSSQKNIKYFIKNTLLDRLAFSSRIEASGGVYDLGDEYFEGSHDFFIAIADSPMKRDCGKPDRNSFADLRRDFVSFAQGLATCLGAEVMWCLSFVEIQREADSNRSPRRAVTAGVGSDYPPQPPSVKRSR